jgi:hypothetical protein
MMQESKVIKRVTDNAPADRRFRRDKKLLPENGNSSSMDPVSDASSDFIHFQDSNLTSGQEQISQQTNESQVQGFGTNVSTTLSSSTINSTKNSTPLHKLDPNLNMPLDEGGGRKSAYNKSEKYKNIGWDSVQLSGTNSFIKPATNSQAFLPMHSKVQESVTEIQVDAHSQKYHSEFIPITTKNSDIVEQNFSEARTEESEQSSEQNPNDSLQLVGPTFFESNFIQLAESKLNRFDTFNGPDEIKKTLRKQDTTPTLLGNYSVSEEVDMAESEPSPLKNGLSLSPSSKKAKNKDAISIESDRVMIKGLGSSSGFSMDLDRGEKSPNAQFIETDAERSPRNKTLTDAEQMSRTTNGGSKESNV